VAPFRRQWHVNLALCVRRQATNLLRSDGDSHIESSGIRFSFLTALPGDLNRFVIEREDPDANRGRLYFMRGDCRFELTVSQSVLRDGQWVLVPLTPVSAARLTLQHTLKEVLISP